jgi:hypothetical protein
VTKNKRKLAYLAAALVLGGAVALGVVFFMGGDSEPVAQESQITSSTSAAAGDSTMASSDTLAADPAKEEPMLDKFKSKDPFVPLGTTNSSSSDSSGNSSTETTMTAKITLNGASYTVEEGDKVPPSDSVFTVTSISSNSVTFGLVSGSFENGDSSIAVNVGESVKVVMEGGDPSYTLKVVSVSSSGNSNSSTSDHTISVLSITESNGVAMVTLEVDGQTYSDLEVGDTVSTSWGEIKVVAINVDAQTVTLMHGDQTLTLSAGQVVVK